MTLPAPGTKLDECGLLTKAYLPLNRLMSRSPLLSVFVAVEVFQRFALRARHGPAEFDYETEDQPNLVRLLERSPR